MSNELIIKSFFLEVEKNSSIVVKEETKDKGTINFISIFNFINYDIKKENDYNIILYMRGEDYETKINLPYIEDLKITENDLGVKIYLNDTIISIEIM